MRHSPTDTLRPNTRPPAPPSWAIQWRMRGLFEELQSFFYTALNQLSPTDCFLCAGLSSANPASKNSNPAEALASSANCLKIQRKTNSRAPTVSRPRGPPHLSPPGTDAARHPGHVDPLGALRNADKNVIRIVGTVLLAEASLHWTPQRARVRGRDRTGHGRLATS